MPTIYSHRSGAQDFRVLEERYSREEWEGLRDLMRQLLEKRGSSTALTLLKRFDWIVMNATNHFEDDFGILYASVSLPEYTSNAHLEGDAGAKKAAEVLANTITEIQPEHSYIRHVAFELNTKPKALLISPPEPSHTSAYVERALADADRLLQAGSAVSAVDRTHTALVGYLRLACKGIGVPTEESDGLAALLKKLGKNHPGLEGHAHMDHIGKVLRSAGAILDALDPIRNRGSMAHANHELLEEPEARLIINVSRSLFHYIDSRLGASRI